MKHGYTYLTIIFLFWTLMMHNTSVVQGLELSVEITDGGTILSLNITGSEYYKSLNQKNHKVNLADGKLSSIWSDVNPIQATAYGINGQISSVYGATDVFFLITQDLDIDWIALQWDQSQSYKPDEMGDREMETGDDMWVFGLTEKVSVLGDAIAHGTEDTFLAEDLQEDLAWERLVINDTDGETPLYIAWEIKRAKITNDVLGGDVTFNTVNSTSLRIASNTAHKQDNDVFKFVLSDLRVGGDVPIDTEPVIETDIDASGFLIKEFSLGLIYGVSMWIIVFVPAGIIAQNQIKKEKEETR